MPENYSGSLKHKSITQKNLKPNQSKPKLLTPEMNRAKALPLVQKSNRALGHTTKHILAAITIAMELVV